MQSAKADHGQTLYAVQKVVVQPINVQSVVAAMRDQLRSYEPYYVHGSPYLRDLLEFWAVERRDDEGDIIPRSYTGEVRVSSVNVCVKVCVAWRVQPVANVQ